MKTGQKEKDVCRGGQSMVEYIILLATVIALLLVLFRPGGPFSQSYNSVIQQQGYDMLNVARTIF